MLGKILKSGTSEGAYKAWEVIRRNKSGLSSASALRQAVPMLKTHGLDDAQVVEAYKRTFGDLSPHKLAASVGNIQKLMGLEDVSLHLYKKGGDEVAAKIEGYNYGIGSAKFMHTFAGKQGGGLQKSYLDLMVVDKNSRGTGAGKKVLSELANITRGAGGKSIGLHANIDVGSYAWAKYGFKPYDYSWDQLRSKLKSEVDLQSQYKDHKESLNKILNNPDPKAIWALSDSNFMSNDNAGNSLNLGKKMMMDQHWYGEVDFTDRASVRRFNKYVKGEK